MFTVTILLLAGSGSLVVTTFPPTEVPVICKVCPLDVATVVSVSATPNTNTRSHMSKCMISDIRLSINLSSLFIKSKKKNADWFVTDLACSGPV